LENLLKKVGSQKQVNFLKLSEVVNFVVELCRFVPNEFK